MTDKRYNARSDDGTSGSGNSLDDRFDTNGKIKSASLFSAEELSKLGAREGQRLSPQSPFYHVILNRRTYMAKETSEGVQIYGGIQTDPLDMGNISQHVTGVKDPAHSLPASHRSYVKL